jgi:type IV pilus assembly protein PilA
MKSVQKGFTLIELMIVVAIIGILAAIAIPAYQDYTIRSQTTEGMNLASSVKAGVAEYYADHGTWPTALVGNAAGALGYTAAPTGKYVSDISLAAAGGGIDITYGLQANSKILTKKLSIRPGLGANGDIVWVCGTASVTGITTAPTATDATSVDPKYLPSVCRP